MNKNKIIILGGHGENDSINGLMRGYIPLFEARGFEVFNYNLSDQSWNRQQLIEVLQSKEVLFALTYLGFGQNISIVTEENGNPKNIWEFFNVPLLKWQGDIAAYLLERHIAIPRNAVNLYPYEEWFYYWKNWIVPTDYSLTRIIQPFPLYSIPLSTVNRKQRLQGKLVFHKTGGNPDSIIEKCKQQLPNSIFSLFKNMCEILISKEYVQKPSISVGDLISTFLVNQGISARISPKLFHFLAAQLDSYSRCVKLTLVVNSLLDFPIVIHGRGWEYIDFSNTKAQNLPPINYEESTDIFLNQFGVIDISPNTSDSPHDRIWRAAGSYNLCITNKQAWIDKFVGFENLMYEFNKESIQETVSNILKNPEESQEMAIAFGERFRLVWTEQKAVDQLIEIAELVSFNFSY